MLPSNPTANFTHEPNRLCDTGPADRHSEPGGAASVLSGGVKTISGVEGGLMKPRRQKVHRCFNTANRH